MSSLEPLTTAKVVLETTKGPIEIDLWAKEVPELTREFMQNCLDEKYVGKTFNKILKNYLVQTAPVDEEKLTNHKDEFHSRIRYDKRGVVGSVHHNRKNTNSVGSFFITLKPTPEFNGTYVPIGKVTNESIYNVMRISESEMNGEVPLYPVKITASKVVVKYFNDLQRLNRISPEEPLHKKPKRSRQPKLTLNYDMEDEEKEEETFKLKSAHEMLGDKKLSSKILIDKPEEEKKTRDTKASVPETPNQNHHQDDFNEKVNLMEEPQLDLHDYTLDRSKQPSPKTKITRDRTIDSDYDSDLDLSDNGSVDWELFNQHKFYFNS